MCKIDIFFTNRNKWIFYANLPSLGTSEAVSTVINFMKYLMGDRSGYLPVNAGLLTPSIFN